MKKICKTHMENKKEYLENKKFILSGFFASILTFILAIALFGKKFKIFNNNKNSIKNNSKIINNDIENLINKKTMLKNKETTLNNNLINKNNEINLKNNNEKTIIEKTIEDTTLNNNFNNNNLISNNQNSILDNNKNINLKNNNENNDLNINLKNNAVLTIKQLSKKFIALFVSLLLIASFVFADGYSGASPTPAAHQTLYVDTITSKTDASPVRIADSQGFEVTTGPVLLASVAGNVGIGTTNPIFDLHLDGTSAPDLLLRSNAASKTAVHLRTDGTNSYINNMNGFVSNGATGNGLLIITGQTGLAFKYGNAGATGTEAMRIDSTGNVGIGTTNPGSKLYIDGTTGSTNQVALSVDGNIDFDVEFSNPVGVNKGIYWKDAEATGGDTGYGYIYREQSTGKLFIGGQGTAGTILESSGNGKVGIGTTIPGYKLTTSASSSHLQLRRESSEITGGKIVYLELFQNDPLNVVPEVYPSIRFHHNSKYWHRIEGRSSGIHFKQGDIAGDAYIKTFAGDGYFGGNVGIGTTDPGTNRLYVKSSGTAEGSLIATFSDSTPTPMVEIFNSNDGTPNNAANAVLKVKRALTTSRSINAAGTINANGADYAEYMEKLNSSEKIDAGDIVGIFDGKITRRTENAQSILVVSTNPAFVGNDKANNNSFHVAFVGQTPVKVRGVVSAGDYILPSGLNDGTGIAKPLSELTFEQYAKQVIGIAWESSNYEGVKKINVAVGIK